VTAVTSKPESCSFRELARRLGVSHTAVQKAIASGRLRKSIAFTWVCHDCGHEWEAVGLGPYDPGPGAVHECVKRRARRKSR